MNINNNNTTNIPQKENSIGNLNLKPNQKQPEEDLDLLDLKNHSKSTYISKIKTLMKTSKNKKSDLDCKKYKIIINNQK